MPVTVFRAHALPKTATYIALIASCALLTQCAHTTGDGPALTLERTVDASTEPGDNFFAYANGAWLKTATIPAGKERWGAREEVVGLVRQQNARLFEDATKAAPGSADRKVADFRAAWQDEAAIETLGVSPLKAQLDSIDAIADKAALTRALGRSLRADVDPLNWGVYQSANVLGLSVEESIHGEKTYVAFLVQGGLGLPNRDQYLSTDAHMRELRATYEHYISSALSFVGSDRTDQRAAKVLELETAIAKTHATPQLSANDHNADNVWTREDFARRAPGLEWPDFFAAAGLEKQTSFVAWQPTAVSGLAALVASQPVETWKDYLRFHLVHAYADVLPRAISEQVLTLRAAATDNHAPPAPRAERAVDATQLAMSGTIGRMYATRYFPAEQKARVVRIAQNVTDAFIKRVEAATWMSKATQSTALAKLHTLYIGVGYPEQWPDETDLVIDAKDAFGNARHVADRNYRRALAKLGQPIDKKEWFMAPQTIGALLVFQQNSYTFAAALLQPPKYDSTASEAATYGAIGAILAHDVTHYIDVLGAEYDIDGAMRRWWTVEDSTRYQSMSEPLVQQFANYHPFPDVAVDGRLTLRENIADLAGLSAAFDAYRLTLGTNMTDKNYVRQHDREFFIAFAQAWRIKFSDAGMRTQLANDHAPEMYRYSTVRNLDAWYDAFDVLPGQKLYLEPKARVKIW